LPKKILQAKFYVGKGKPWNKADNFCLIVRKHDAARGSLDARLTIFASLCASTIRQGEATKWLKIFAEEMKIRPLIFRNLLLKIFRKIKNALRPSSVAVRRHLPPGGKAISKAKINFWTKK